MVLVVVADDLSVLYLMRHSLITPSIGLSHFVRTSVELMWKIRGRYHDNTHFLDWRMTVRPRKQGPVSFIFGKGPFDPSTIGFSFSL